VIRNTALPSRYEILGYGITIRGCGLTSGRSPVQKLTLAVAIAALVTIGACKKTGEGQYEVQKPVVGTQTDTVNTPSIETGTVKDTVTITRPTVDVKSADENKKENK
jgi:hypothetical protein